MHFGMKMHVDVDVDDMLDLICSVDKTFLQTGTLVPLYQGPLLLRSGENRLLFRPSLGKQNRRGGFSFARR